MSLWLSLGSWPVLPPECSGASSSRPVSPGWVLGTSVPASSLAELPSLHPQHPHRERAEIPLHGAHIPGRGGREDLCHGEGLGGPEGALPGPAVPHRGLQGVSFTPGGASQWAVTPCEVSRLEIPPPFSKYIVGSADLERHNIAWKERELSTNRELGQLEANFLL